MKKFLLWLVACFIFIAGTTTNAQLPPLQQQVGFADPKLAELEARGQNTLGESADIVANGHSYRLLAIWQPAPDASTTSPVGGSALLYQMDNGQPILRWSQDYLALTGQAPYLTNQTFGFFPAPAPGDWNGDGNAEFAIYASFAGTAWFNSILYIYQIQPDDTVRSVLKGAIPSGHIVSAVEALGDGSVLFTVSDIRGEMAMGLPNCCGPYTLRYFEWRNGVITNASATYPGKYFETIGNLIYYVTTSPIQDPVDYSARLLELLMAYESTGQRDAGWLLVNSLVQQAKQAGRLAEGTYVDQIFLPAMTQMYQGGTPFVAPDMLPNTAIDFYSETPLVTP